LDFSAFTQKMLRSSSGIVVLEVRMKPEAVKEFSRCEMRVSGEVFYKMKIEKIFPPSKENWNTLYVQFASVSSVQTFYKNSRYLQTNQRLVPYIPKELYPRFKKLQSIAYTLRHSDLVPALKTNMTILHPLQPLQYHHPHGQGDLPLC
jgi:hypothetical protein